MVRCLTSYEYGEARAIVGIDSISLCREESCAFWVWWICQAVTVMWGNFGSGLGMKLGLAIGSNSGKSILFLYLLQHLMGSRDTVRLD